MATASTPKTSTAAKAPEATETPEQRLTAAVTALLEIAKPLADLNQVDVGDYRLQFAGGVLLSMSHR